jgi:hypothetical protein
MAAPALGAEADPPPAQPQDDADAGAEADTEPGRPEPAARDSAEGPDGAPPALSPEQAWRSFAASRKAGGSGLGELLLRQPPTRHDPLAKLGLAQAHQESPDADPGHRLPDAPIDQLSAAEPTLGSLIRGFDSPTSGLPEPKLGKPAAPEEIPATEGPEFDPPPLPIRRPAPSAALELPARGGREWLAPLLVLLVLAAGIGAFLAVWMSAPDGGAGGLEPGELLARARARLVEWGLLGP